MGSGDFAKMLIAGVGVMGFVLLFVSPLTGACFIGVSAYLLFQADKGK